MKIKNKLRKTGRRLKHIFTYMLVYLTIAGAYTFTAFIIEEAEQQVIWGTWPAQDSKNWALVMEGCDLLKNLNKTMNLINWSIGYIQPLALISYHSYWKSTEYYIKGIETKIFANAPDLFNNRKIKIMFTPKKIKKENNRIILINRKIRIITDKIPKTRRVVVSGIVRVDGEKIIIEESKE